MYKSFLSSPEACRSTAEKRFQQLTADTQTSAEAKQLETLLRYLDRQEIAHSSRFNLLLRELGKLKWTGWKSSPRLLVFTESRVTQEHLARALAKHFKLKYSDEHEAQPDQALAIIHGGMPDVVLSATVESFGTGTSPIRMLLATDVASEGVNLHHQCHNIIHYDLPWSIITLIQRNGRIEDQLANLPPEGKRATRLRTQREEMEKYLHDREENWKNTHLYATDEPTTRLVLAIEGVR